jgi:hypothetical protein
MRKFGKVVAPTALEPAGPLVVSRLRVVQRGLAEPPAPRAPAVLEQRGAIARELADLKTQIAETALAAYEGKSDGRERLAALDTEIRACAFQLDCNGLAHELALRLDQDAVEAWKATIQAMPPEKIIAGISSKDCCRLCSAEHGCVITNGGNCAHPVKIGVLDPRSRGVPSTRAAYVAATAKLNLKGHG